MFFIKTTSNLGFIQEKLPRLSLSKNLSFHSKKYEILQNNAKIEFTRFFQVLEKDSMESYIKDSSIWFKSMGKSKLNLVFIKEVLKNFHYI